MEEELQRRLLAERSDVCSETPIKDTAPVCNTGHDETPGCQRQSSPDNNSS